MGASTMMLYRLLSEPDTNISPDTPWTHRIFVKCALKRMLYLFIFSLKYSIETFPINNIRKLKCFWTIRCMKRSAYKQIYVSFFIYTYFSLLFPYSISYFLKNCCIMCPCVYHTHVPCSPACFLAWKGRSLIYGTI